MLIKLTDGKNAMWVDPAKVLLVDASDPRGSYVNVGGTVVYLAVPAEEVVRQVNEALRETR